jgi:hypothetical protein
MFLVFTHVDTGHGIFIIKGILPMLLLVLPTPVVQGIKGSHGFFHVL